MKKMHMYVTALVLTISAYCQSTLNDNERKYAVDHLKQTQSELFKTIKGLSEEQLNFKAKENSWSIAECLEHIAISEKNLMDMVQNSLKAESDPSKREKLAMSDDQLLALISSRDQKVKTRKEFEPTNQFGGFDATLKVFKERRKNNIKYVKTTQEDLRNHFLDFPFGSIDTYQAILFMSGHTKRHTNQIIEIKQNDQFPL